MHQFRIQLGETLGYFDALFQSVSPELPYSKKRPLLVICAHAGPGRDGGVGAGEHGVAGGGIVGPLVLRHGIER